MATVNFAQQRCPVFIYLLVIAVLHLSVSACRLKDDATRLEKLSIEATDTGTSEYLVEIADTERSRRLGLMHRKEMPAEHGMLLVYRSPQRVNIWMKNTYLPLDILFIDVHGMVTRISRNAEPLSTRHIPSGDKVLAVLELNAGEVMKYGITKGSRVIHPYFKQD